MSSSSLRLDDKHWLLLLSALLNLDELLLLLRLMLMMLNELLLLLVMNVRGRCSLNDLNILMVMLLETLSLMLERLNGRCRRICDSLILTIRIQEELWLLLNWLLNIV